jgi:UDP-N-acetylmuramoyl-L-alanyl-D-glutamate--2,6-diaminopimelate ligase
MKKLSALFPEMTHLLHCDKDIRTLTFDSRKAIHESIFFAIVGFTTNGHQYVEQAFNQGCRVFVVQEKVDLPDEAIVIAVSDTALTLGQVACAFHDFPSNQLTLVGITGTNGKTTSATLLHELFTGLGYKCGLLSTVVNKIGQENIPSTHTTPDPIALNALLAQMVQEGCSYCFMEVSSHAVHQKRIAGLNFAVAGFTNITHDHLDYHHTFAAYIQAKKAFFDGLHKSAASIVNADDRNGLIMTQNSSAKKYTYALKSPADYKGKILENSLNGLILQINGIEVYTRLVGAFNAYNLLLVFAVAQILQQESLEVLKVLSNLGAVEGRFQLMQSDGGISVIVDYAHTPDALENVLQTIAQVRKSDQRILTVVGCGGDRDKTKRPEMAKIAALKSDQVILTSDNPRSENPEMILDEMEKGLDEQALTKTLRITDRTQAIKTAIKLAQPSDVVLIAGKGHEKYQEINGIKHPFDDVQIAKEIFVQLKK